ncbi:glycosyltransferase family 25 protein [Pseudochrobactrum sp. sp1633]|uniref:glycosyltransferase family 25 protein n=1 Tax=Pseudochrobactrum sp. sp1633 TaxID=3036706 RepID=UPI0025A675F3|nr:glycosyltransferase family 25 protein [Pseudochrobactrum sp. sp1633]MDM8346520.1 glycosyltransferase family 25 protein [Pseudochrobactrum sp. sp1633]HWD12737.1 glycosyltransferase family 25 protein [Pseudochrobactrum sp.]
MQQQHIKAFIIHLERATERRAQVSELVSQLPVPAEIITAIDAKQLRDADVTQAYQPRLHKPYYPFRLSRNEVACFLSHRKTWQAIVDQNLDAALVLEDDVALTEDFPAAFSAAVSVAAQGGLVRLPFRSDRETGAVVLESGTTKVIRPVPVGLGMVAQLITRNAAQALLKATEQFDRPVDTFAQMSWVTELKPLSVVPGGVQEISANLGGSTLKQPRSLAHKLHRELMRPLYRHSVKIYSRKSG